MTLVVLVVPNKHCSIANAAFVHIFSGYLQINLDMSSNLCTKWTVSGM